MQGNGDYFHRSHEQFPVTLVHIFCNTSRKINDAETLIDKLRSPFVYFVGLQRLQTLHMFFSGFTALFFAFYSFLWVEVEENEPWPWNIGKPTFSPHEGLACVGTTQWEGFLNIVFFLHIATFSKLGIVWGEVTRIFGSNPFSIGLPFGKNVNWTQKYTGKWQLIW